ncbi:MAG: helix-turn-helix domain-containing protein [Phycisphaerales bacterium]|nr:helix-turn-helix domain-containing protein [Phycisphaerales bacterium]
MNDSRHTRYTLRKHEAANALGISERKVHDLLKSGELPSFKVGRVVLIPVAGVQAFIASQIQTGGQM